jgi:hypothetical protein
MAATPDSRCIAAPFLDLVLCDRVGPTRNQWRGRHGEDRAAQPLSQHHRQGHCTPGVSTGEAIASEVLRFRNRSLRRRALAVGRIRPSRRAPPVARKRTAVLVAEGDSWFSYPWHAVLQMLEDEYGYDVESVAHTGDRIETWRTAAANSRSSRAPSRNCCGSR